MMMKHQSLLTVLFQDFFHSDDQIPPRYVNPGFKSFSLLYNTPKNLYITLKLLLLKLVEDIFIIS